MAYDSPQGIKLTGLVCGSVTLAAQQYRFVKLDTDGTVIVSSAQGEICIGVLQNKPVVGLPCEIIAIGVTKLKTDATAFAEGSKLTTDGSGNGDQAASADHVLGVALTTPTATAGVIFTALVNCATPPVLA